MQRIFIKKWEDDGRCTACRTCEVVCSYHHTGGFAPSKSSLRIVPHKIAAGITIELDETCDGCSGEAGKLCSEFCPRGVLPASIWNNSDIDQ